MRTVEELRRLIVKSYWEYVYIYRFNSRDCGEILCYHIHELNMSFRELAEHFDITLDELAEIIADHIRRL